MYTKQQLTSLNPFIKKMELNFDRMARTNCDNCGNNICKSPRILEQNKHNFCNKECYKEWLNNNKDLVSKRNKKIAVKYWKRRNEKLNTI